MNANEVKERIASSQVFDGSDSWTTKAYFKKLNAVELTNHSQHFWQISMTF